jgi:UDP-N-acetylmuramoyl-tripeptide--D-alanyl-D-alanine ligase
LILDVDMNSTSLQRIAQWCGIQVRSGEDSPLVQRVVTDSRIAGPGDLFVALRGERFDGSDFIDNVRAQGAACAIAEAGRGARPAGFPVLETGDTLHALQRLSAAYRRTLSAKVVGITGSSGKTSTKDFAFAVLCASMSGWCTQGNLNNHIGVPLTLLRGDSNHRFAVVEMGMNHAGEIATLAELAAPDVAVITNVGVAHIEFLGSREAIAREKGSLAAAVGVGGTVVLSAEDEFSEMIAGMTAAEVLTAGIGRGEVQAVDVQVIDGGAKFGVVYEGERAECELAVPGLHMVRNATLAVAAGLAMGVSLKEAARGLRGMTLSGGRMEMRTLRGIHFLDDTYNANPDSMRAALSTLAHWPANGRRIAVLGKMGELGSFAEAGHRDVGRAAGVGIDRLLTVGSQADWISLEARDAGMGDVSHFEDHLGAVAALRAELEPGDVVLVKGSRSARMERVIEELALP